MSPRPLRAWQHHVAEAENARQRATSARQTKARITEALDQAAAEKAAGRLAATWTKKEDAR
ncbi:hypothetical protein [Streptomyces sp. NPDC058045]|uniref:hypothetical protein n=1 Tax=Streptomyces sp. NPDC058045 TaxID=3346311 RepID=UPI0036EFB9FA